MMRAAGANDPRRLANGNGIFRPIIWPTAWWIIKERRWDMILREPLASLASKPVKWYFFSSVVGAGATRIYASICHAPPALLIKFGCLKTQINHLQKIQNRETAPECVCNWFVRELFNFADRCHRSSKSDINQCCWNELAYSNYEIRVCEFMSTRLANFSDALLP